MNVLNKRQIEFVRGLHKAGAVNRDTPFTIDKNAAIAAKDGLAGTSLGTPGPPARFIKTMIFWIIAMLIPILLLRLLRTR